MMMRFTKMREQRSLKTTVIENNIVIMFGFPN